MAYQRWDPELPLPRDEILHALRSDMERAHRQLVWERFTDLRWLYQPNVMDLDSVVADMTLDEAADCCNKAVPIYVFSVQESAFITPLLHSINRFVYQKWHRPYRNEIEYVQFLAKLVLPWYLPNDLQPGPLVDLATTAHKVICDRVEAARDAVGDLDPDNLQEPLDPILPKNWVRYSNLQIPEIIRSQRYLILRPLFRALIISTRAETYLDVDADISQFSVLLIRTGVEDGLSAPISFEPIANKIHGFIHGSNGQVAAQMTLETAVDFVIYLESREIAAFGHQPDPVASTRDLDDGGILSPCTLNMAKRLGWGEEPLAGPSSQWVQDLEKFPPESRWSRDIERVISYWEEKARNRLRKVKPEEILGSPWKAKQF